MEQKRETARKLFGCLFAMAMAIGLLCGTSLTAYADEPASYKVEVQNSEHGSVTAAATSAAVGGSVALTVAPDAGYALKSLTATYREAFTEVVVATYVATGLAAPDPPAESEHFKSKYGIRSSAFGWGLAGYDYSLEISPKQQYSDKGYLITSVELKDPKATGKPNTNGIDTRPGDWAVATDDGRLIFNNVNSDYFYCTDYSGKRDDPRMISTATIHALMPSQSVAIAGSGDARTFTMPAGDVTISAVFAQQPTLNTAPAAKSGLAYKGSEQELVAAGSATGGTVHYALGDVSGATEAYGASIPAATNAGTYHVWYKVVGDEGHADTAPASVTATIAKADPTAGAPAGLTASFGQTLADVALANPAGNTPGTWAWADASASVGDVGSRSFKANFTPADAANYNAKANVDVTVAVGKAVVEPPVIVEKPYISETKTQVADVPASSLYAVTTNAGGANVGSYPVVLTLTDTAHYTWPDSDSADITLTFKVEKAPAPIAQPVTYNPNQTLADVRLERADGWDWEWLEPDTVPKVGNSGYDVILRDVDDKTYNLDGVRGYNKADHSVTWNIPVEVAKAVVIVPDIPSKTYTGKRLTADVANSDFYTVTRNDGGTDVGSYDVVLTLADPANSCWADGGDAPKTLRFQITMAGAPAIDVPTPAAVTYDPSKTLADVPLTGSWAWADPSIVPTVENKGYEVKQVADDANRDYTGVEGYDAQSHTVTRTVALTVNKADVTLKVAIDGWTYGEAAKAPVVSGNVSGGEVLIVYAPRNNYDTYTATAPTEAGDYTVGVYVYPTDNYNEAYALADFTVAKAASPVKVAGTAHVKQGKSIDLLDNVELNGATGAVTFELVPPDASAACSLDGSRLQAEPKSAGYATVYVTVAADANHEALEKTPISVWITEKDVPVITAADVEVTYGTTGARVSAKVVGTVPGHEVDCGLESYTVQKGSEDLIDVDLDTGVLTLKKVGTAYVEVGVGGNDFYEYVEKVVKVTIKPADLSKAKVKLAQTSVTYDGSAKKPAVKLVIGGKALNLKANTDYDVSYANNRKAGTATVKVTGKGNCTGWVTATFKISKAKNSLSVSTAKRTVKASWKAKTVKPIVKAKPRFKATVTYAKAKTAKAKKMSGYKALSVDKKTGKVTVKAGTLPGTYKMMVKVSAAGTDNAKAASKTVTVTVKVTASSKSLLKAQSEAPRPVAPLTAAATA